MSTNTAPVIKSQEQALSIIFKGLDVAQSKGAFTLEEASILAMARSLFLREDESAPAAEESAPEESAPASGESSSPPPVPPSPVKPETASNVQE